MGVPSCAWAEGDPDGQRWWSHVLVLADDKLEGRNTGSPGHRKAAEYVAREFERAGFKPAGTDGYFQPVRLISREIDEAHSSLTLVKDLGGEEPLVLGRDAILSARVEPAPSLETGLVFAGYGLSIPEAHHDDFAGLDVRGKLVVALLGARGAGAVHAVDEPGRPGPGRDPRAEADGHDQPGPRRQAASRLGA
jgi:hypothetical protein